jgi:thioredoxin 1
MTRLSIATVLLLSSATILGCSRAESAPLQPALQPAHAVAPGSRPRLVFFMNPNGRPCQMQDQILRGMPDLSAWADVVYYRTTEPADIARFQEYGIRSLPQLIVTDANGAELRRATPGILSDPDVRRLLAP